MKVPVIESERLRLRGHQMSDLDACASMWGDPSVTTFIGGQPSSRPEVWRRILSYIGHWELFGFGSWLVEEKATGSFVGEINFARWMRGIDFIHSETPEAGWALHPKQQGKGYALEGLLCALNWIDGRSQFEFTNCMVNPENARSLSLAEKLGYYEVGRATLTDEPLVLMNRARPSS